MSMDLALWALNFVLGGVMWLLRNSYNDLKKHVEKNAADIERVNEKALKKEDFIDFKRELWQRLDRFEDSVNAKLL